MEEEITLRQLEPTDGPAIDLLGRQTPDTGAVAFYTVFHMDPYECLLALNPGMVGVVAQAPDHEGIVGMGLITFGECLYEGELLPSAYLSSLSVHPHYRLRGIASRLSKWRVEAAEDRFRELGREGVVFAGIQGGNTGSVKTAERWSTQQLIGHTHGAVVKVRSQPPKSAYGLEVRPIRPQEYEEVVEKQNDFYKNHNLYPPQTAKQLSEWRSKPVLGHQIHDYVVAVRGGDNIVAGLSTTAEGKLLSTRAIHLPLPLRIANIFMKLIPPDGVNKRVKIEQFWFSPGYLDAGKFLWESVRWLQRDQGTMLMVFFDPHSPLHEAISIPKYMPSNGGTLALKAPVPAREDRPLYLHI